MKKGLFSIFATFILASCTSLASYLANSSVDESELNINSNIAYGQKDVQKLDIISAKNQDAKSPVIIFYYGGGYSDGSKEMYLFIADYFAKRGYVVAIPDYSKYPNVKFPEFVEDGALAFNWVKDNISKYGGDANDIILIGHSAGAHIAALLTYDENYGVSENVKSFIGLAGPYNFIPEEEKYKKIFGPPENYKNMHVDNFVDGNEAPALLLWGAEDEIVGKRNIEILSDAINWKGGNVQTQILKNVDHISIISAFTKIRQNKDVTNLVDEYLKR